jgi:hypothetical protein
MSFKNISLKTIYFHDQLSITDNLPKLLETQIIIKKEKKAR